MNNIINTTIIHLDNNMAITSIANSIGFIDKNAKKVIFLNPSTNSFYNGNYNDIITKLNSENKINTTVINFNNNISISTVGSRIAIADKLNKLVQLIVPVENTFYTNGKGLGIGWYNSTLNNLNSTNKIDAITIFFENNMALTSINDLNFSPRIAIVDNNLKKVQLAVPNETFYENANSLGPYWYNKALNQLIYCNPPDTSPINITTTNVIDNNVCLQISNTINNINNKNADIDKYVLCLDDKYNTLKKNQQQILDNTSKEISISRSENTGNRMGCLNSGEKINKCKEIFGSFPNMSYGDFDCGYCAGMFGNFNCRLTCKWSQNITNPDYTFHSKELDNITKEYESLRKILDLKQPFSLIASNPNVIKCDEIYKKTLTEAEAKIKEMQNNINILTTEKNNTEKAFSDFKLQKEQEKLTLINQFNNDLTQLKQKNEEDQKQLLQELQLAKQKAVDELTALFNKREQEYKDKLLDVNNKIEQLQKDEKIRTDNLMAQLEKERAEMETKLKTLYNERELYYKNLIDKINNDNTKILSDLKQQQQAEIDKLNSEYSIKITKIEQDKQNLNKQFEDFKQQTEINIANLKKQYNDMEILYEKKIADLDKQLLDKNEQIKKDLL
jgi:hypothetical protein